MTSVWKKLIVLLWKCMVLRKRNWILTIFEFISPILVVFLVYFVNKKVLEQIGTKDSNEEHVDFKYVKTNHSDSDYRFISSFASLYNSTVNIKEFTYIAYAPNTTFTDQLMTNYKNYMESRNPNLKLEIEAKISEADLDAFLREHLLTNSKYTCVIGVLFSELNMTFKYKIMGNYDEILQPTQYPYTSSTLFKLQVYLDAQYLKSVDVNYDDTKVFIGEFLQNKQASKSNDEISKVKKAILYWLYVCLTLAYTFLVTAVVRDTIQEKSSGIKELMRIMGLSSWMIWIHWFMYSLFVQIPVTVGLTVLLTVIYPPVFKANVFIVWLLFLLFTIDYIVIFFFITCFFGRATKGTVFCVLGWIIINFALLYIFDPKNHKYLVQLLITLIPLINLCWALQSLDSFSWRNIDWDFSLLFSEGYSDSHISAGLAIVIMICEIILFTLLLAYLDAVMPGRYGVAKPATFIFGCCVKLWQKNKYSPGSETVTLPSNFELPPPGTKVGIRIQRLRKEFGVFKKFVAVENVNLDIYEGEVTVLLGHNGAGKTTTMSMITGMFSPSSGTISVDGKNIYDNLFNFRQSLGLCTQHNLYFPKLTVIEHLVFFGMLKGRSHSKAKEEGMYLLYMLNLVDKRNLRGSKLSGGMLRRLCLAVALTGGPKVLILDEPTSGLDPENRRHIWDIILSLRGERTILITTHYMEEADVLGDRIAIMDHGKVVCCGTTMFLKKLYGTGYNVHVTKNPRASLTDIKHCLQRFIPQFKTKVVSPAQVDYSIKDEFVERFPDLFGALESSMNSLGVTAIAVSCTTMEDVFLRVAELSEEQDQSQDESKMSNVIQDRYDKVKGGALTVQQIETLVMKQVLIIYNHFISTIIKFVIACLFMLAAIMLANNYKTKDNAGESSKTNQRFIDLTLYPDFIYPIIYDESHTKTAKIAQNIIKNNKGQAFMVQFENSSQFGTIYQPMHKLLAELSHSSKSANSVFLASTFIKNDFLIQYQPVLNPFAPSNAANLMANILLKRTHPNRSIEIISHSLTSERKGCPPDLFLKYICAVFFLVSFIPFALTLVVAECIPLIVEERVTGFKYQLIIAGISPLIYRLSSFICDLCLYILFIIVSLVIILTAGSGIMPLSSENTTMLFLVLLLYGVSSFIFLYAFAHISNNGTTISGLYISLNLLFTLACPVSLLIMSFNNLFIQVVITGIASLHPTAAAFFALYSIAVQIANENICPLSGEIDFLKFPTDSNRYSIFIYILFLFLDIILYTIIIFLIDSNIFARITYKRSAIQDCQGGDSDVKYETQRVRMFKEANVDTTPLRVEGLVKNFGVFRAANQVSFLVTSGECFGLLGVNGAGKTTTFKMLTGEIIPSSGDAFSTKYSVVSQTNKYLSNIGYCPQFDALLDDLTGNSILSIIAKVKGVPRSQVRNQVDYWMKTLGIEEHANKRSKTYSGGTKRKLGTAMAFIGEPIIALLDEPTTGVDPAARRKVWGVVKDRQSLGYSAVLSSHSMEECEALCSRLTIMRKGELVCIGSVQQLKTKFGQGYMVLLKFAVTEDYEKQLEILNKVFLRIFPKSVIQDQNINMITYRVLDNKIPLSRLFSEVINIKNKYTIVEDFIVTNATLEQLFLMIARGQDIRSSRSNDSQSKKLSAA